jgi:hypothetical protein
MSDIKEETISFVGKWLRETDSARKLFDVLTISLGLFVAGTLWVAYTRQDTVLDMLGTALDKYPKIDSEVLGREFDNNWKIAQQYGAVALQVESVDLSDNTRVVLRIQQSVDKETLDLGKEGWVRPFCPTVTSPDNLQTLADLITGDYAVAPRDPWEGYLGLYVPLPDRAGRLLCGIVIVTFELDTPRDTVRACRTALVHFTDALVR